MLYRYFELAGLIERINISFQDFFGTYAHTIIATKYDHQKNNTQTYPLFHAHAPKILFTILHLNYEMINPRIVSETTSDLDTILGFDSLTVRFLDSQNQ